MIRAFFAIDLPVTVKEKIADTITMLQKHIAAHTIRWVKQQHLHITLQFLEAVKEKDLPQLVVLVRTEIENVHPCELHLGPIELFPPHHSHIISLAVKPNDTLSQLSAAIRRGMTAMNYPAEQRLFRGHVTLGRINNRHSEITLPECDSLNRETITVNEIVLFQSEPGTDGSRYTPLSIMSLSP